MRSAERLLVAFGLLVAVLFLGAAPAAAHAALVSAEPSAGSEICSGPSQVLLTFSEGVLLSSDSLRVLDPSGRDVETDAAHHAAGNQQTAVVGLRPGMPHGTYTVVWQVVSADTHPVSGAYTFVVGAPSKTSAAVPQQQVGQGPVALLYAIGRWIGYAGFAVLVGAAVFLTACWPRGAGLRVMQRLVMAGWAALAGSTVALLLLRSPYAEGTSLGSAFDPAVLQAAVSTKPGEALLVRLVLLAAAAVLLAVMFGSHARSTDPVGRRSLGYGPGAAGAAVAVGIALTWSAVEHASVGLQPAVAIPVDVAHLLAVAVWLGGLAALVTALYRVPDIEPAAVRRFSRIAFAAVCVLAASGVYQSWRQVGSWPALTGTAYGRLLLVKVALVAVLVGIAAFSRRWTGRLADGTSAEPGAAVPAVPAAADPPAQTAGPAGTAPPAGTDPPADTDPPAGTAPPAGPAPLVPADPQRAAQLARQQAAFAAARVKKQRDADPARTALRRSVLAETAVAVLVLAVATSLSSTEPARTAKAAAGRPAAAGGPDAVLVPYDTGGPNGKGTAEVRLDPARTGPNRLDVTLAGPGGRPVDVPEVDAALTLASRGIGPLAVPLQRVGTGDWAATGLQVPMPGVWRLDLTVRTSDIDEVTETTNLTITQG